MLDVGQGNAILVRTPQHHAALFDGGPGGCDLGRQLHALGVDELDLVVISHPHADHFAGLLEAVGGLRVDALIDDVQLEFGAVSARGSPAAPRAATGETRASSTEAGDYIELRHELARMGCTHALAATGYSVRLDGVTVSFFAPPTPLDMVDGPSPWVGRGQEPSGDELNGGSVVTVVAVGNVTMVLPGDAEADVLDHYRLPPSAVLVVPHHGSRGAVSGSLLKRLGTKVAFISVGADNTFGHPNPATLATLTESVGCVLRTDLAGWVSCTVKGVDITIKAEHMPANDRETTPAR